MNNISSVWTNDMFLVTHSEEKRQTANGNEDDVFDDVTVAQPRWRRQLFSRCSPSSNDVNGRFNDRILDVDVTCYRLHQLHTTTV